jgi:hypothetical protein
MDEQFSQQCQRAIEQEDIYDGRIPRVDSTDDDNTTAGEE